LNLFEFVFAFCTVFGVSGFWWYWTKFVYSFEEKPSKKEEAILNQNMGS
tara:strand:- start:444 stop:590 length:147 start_codon:yes stop_codon:yes gene_type:complete